jgi:pilus assembly protein CpaE
MAKILVVDDDRELLEMMRIVLERAEVHEALLAADAEEGLAIAVADKPEVAIVDIMMPRVDGYEMIRRLRAHPATASIPIIVLTARGQSVDREAALDAGAAEFLPKPATASELLAAIEAVLGGSTETGRGFDVTSVALLSLRGGVGVTTLASNLAATLLESTGESVCLLDLSPSSGHVALQLGLRPDPNWSGLLAKDSLDADIVGRLLIRHASGLWILASPPIPVLGSGLARRTVSELMDILTAQYAAIVVDTPPVLNDMAIATLDAVNQILLVVTLEPSSVQTAIGAMRALDRWSDKVRVVLNHPRPDEQWPVSALERLLRHTPIGTVPFDQDQTEALKTGVPLVMRHPEGPFAQAVRHIVSEAIRVEGAAHLS